MDRKQTGAFTVPFMVLRDANGRVKSKQPLTDGWAERGGHDGLRPAKSCRSKGAVFNPKLTLEQASFQCIGQLFSEPQRGQDQPALFTLRPQSVLGGRYFESARLKNR